jgi:hypothetical protein
MFCGVFSCLGSIHVQWLIVSRHSLTGFNAMIATKTRHRVSYVFIDGELIPSDRSKRTSDDVRREYAANNGITNHNQDAATLDAMITDNPGCLVVLCRSAKGITLGAYLYPVRSLTPRSIPTALESLSLPPRTASVVFAHRDRFTESITVEANRFAAESPLKIKITDFLTIAPK